MSDIKILDLTNVIAGPTIASLMSRFGAEVIKLDPIKSTFDPWNTIVFGMQAGRGKESLLCNIKTPEGRAIFDKLLQWADIVTINAVDRQVLGLGLDEASLKAINPRAILCQVDAFGGPQTGAMSNHLGYDDNVQAATGIMVRFGGSRETPEEHAHLGTIDVLGGFCAATAAAAALLRRERTGEVGCARASLSAAGQLIQLPFMYDHTDRAPFDEPSGRTVLGYGSHYHFYKAKDGWFFLACASVEELENKMGLKGKEDLKLYLKDYFKTKAVQDCLKELSDLNIGAVEPSSMADLRNQYISHNDLTFKTQGGSYQFVRHDIKGAGRYVELFAPCAIRPKSGVITAYPPAEKYGNSTVKTMGMIGYDMTGISDLLDRSVIATKWSDDYLPD